MDLPQQQQRGAPPYKGIAFVLLAIVVILLTGCVLFLWEVGYFQPAMSEAQARQLIQQAGGAEKIAREASRMLKIEKYPNGEFHSLSIYDNPPKITNYPALLVLVTNSETGSLAIEPANRDVPPNIRIMYGPHRRIRFMSIFDVTNGLGQQFRDSNVQLSSNIFFSK